MKKTLLTFLALILTTFSFATFSIDWMKTADFLTSSGTSIARDASDNVYTTTSEGSIYLEKRDKFGNFLWRVNSTTTLPLNYEFPVKVHVDPFGNPVVVGYRHTHSSSGNNANALIILKYQPDGTLIYKKLITGSFSYFNNSRYWTNVSSEMDADGYLYLGTEGLVDGYSVAGYNAIKVSPSGSTVRVSSKNFPSGTNFHFVMRLRLSGNKIGLTGVTSYSSANSTTWVLDTAGNDLWSSIDNGVQGKDLAFDNNGNTYILTWISTASSGDVTLYKYNSAGVQQWVQNYDFGGSELSSRMELGHDSNLVIMAYGNSAPGGSYYVDWITIKVDLAGTKLWSDRYDEHSSNDEYPGMIALDAADNIYITGIGGPFPGGNSLGRQQMVTLKYTPAGTREWASALDTINEYMTGTGIAIASDSSIFVLGDVNTFIIHYFDHTGSAPCQVPAGISSSNLTTTSSDISWTAVPDAYLYHIEYKTSPALTWIRVSTDTNYYTLSPLYSGTLYDYRVEAICNSGPTGFSPVQQFTTGGSGYCASMGMDGTHEFIDLVYLETLLNSTPETDSGYADYTNLSTTLQPGNTYDITLSAEIIPFGATENWKVWIDFNGNGDFTDAGEEVVSYSSMQIGWETSTFTVPLNALQGPARMRVSLKNGNPAQGPCEIFAFGEVEDYTINISGTTGIENNTEKNIQLALYPNPVGKDLTIIYSGDKPKADIIIYDISGRIIMNDIVSLGRSIINVQDLSRGIYFIRLSGNVNVQSAIKFIKE